MTRKYLDAQARLVTDIHTALRNAEAATATDRAAGFVREANALIDSVEFIALPEAVQKEALDRFRKQALRIMPLGA